MDIAEIYSRYQELAAGKNKANVTELAIYNFKVRQATIPILRHKLEPALQSEAGRAEWLREARKVGVPGTDKEIIKYVQTWHSKAVGEFKGKCLQGIFVEACGSLFDCNWQPNLDIIQAVHRMSLVEGKTVVVITNIDNAFVKSKLKECSLYWPIISKRSLQGAKLEIVVDFLNQDLGRQQFEDRDEIAILIYI